MTPSRALPHATALAGLLALTIAAALTHVDPAQADTVLFSDDFSDDSQGWMLGPEWEIGPATTSAGHGTGGPDPATDHTPTDDNGVAGVVIGGNASTSVHPSYWLTSPVLDTSATIGPLWLEYERWLNSDYTPFMQNQIQVFDGSAWSTIWESGSAPGIADSSWTHIQNDISSFKSAQTQVRFGFLVGSTGVFPASSWNVDDVLISVRDNTPPVVADDGWNGDEDQLLQIAAPGVLSNDFDTEPLTVGVVNPPDAGELVLSPDGSFTYQPSAEFSGQDQFSYEACDAGGLCAMGMVTLDIASINDPPVANDDADSILTGETSVVDVLANDIDVEADPLEVSTYDPTSTQGGAVSCTSDGTCTLTPLVGFTGMDTYTYTVSDGQLEDSATVTVNIEGAAEPSPTPSASPSPPPSADDASPTSSPTTSPSPTETAGVAPTAGPGESASVTNIDGVVDGLSDTGGHLAMPILAGLLLLVIGGSAVGWSFKLAGFRDD